MQAVVGEFGVELEEVRRRALRRMLVFSVAGHGLLLALFVGLPREHVVRPPAGVIAVDLVGALAPRAPEAAATRKPAPPVKKIVLPKEPTKPKPVEKAQAKDEPAEAPKEIEKPAEREYSDVLDQLRAEAGESAPEAAQQAAAEAGAAGSGVAVSPEVAAWMRRAKIHVRRAWVVPPGFRTQELEAHVLIDLAADGSVRGKPKLTRRSGNPWYDESVVRAIRKASPLPKPPEADEWAFVFSSEDSY